MTIEIPKPNFDRAREIKDEFLSFNDRGVHKIVEPYIQISYLIPLIDGVVAYIKGAIEAAWEDFEKSDYYENVKDDLYERDLSKSEPLVRVGNKTYPENIDPTTIKNAAKVEVYYKDNLSSADEYLGYKEEKISIEKLMDSEFFPAYIPFRRNEAERLARKLGISNKVIQAVQQIAFNNCIAILKGKIHLNADEELAFVFIEDAVDGPLANLLKDLNLTPTSLKILRQDSPSSPNTICRSCRRFLTRNDKKFYCSREENPKCYFVRWRAHNTTNREFDRTIELGNKCLNCGKIALVTHTHKGKPFCSSECHAAYRKREWRRSKKDLKVYTPILTN